MNQDLTQQDYKILRFIHSKSAVTAMDVETELKLDLQEAFHLLYRLWFLNLVECNPALYTSDFYLTELGKHIVEGDKHETLARSQED